MSRTFCGPHSRGATPATDCTRSSTIPRRGYRARLPARTPTGAPSGVNRVAVAVLVTATSFPGTDTADALPSARRERVPLRATRPFLGGEAAFARGVPHVVDVCADTEMQGVDARRVVARMHHEKTARNRTVEHPVGPTVRQLRVDVRPVLSATSRQPTVTVRSDTPFPLDAVFVHRGPPHKEMTSGRFGAASFRSMQ